MSYFASTAQRALSNLIDRLPDRDAAQKDIEIIYGALLMLDDHERCLREINATLFHHNKDREQTLAGLGGDMIDLQQARREAAQRFYAIGMNSLPGGWTFTFRKSLSGRCWHGRKHIDAPRPVTRKSLYIWLHECAHAHMHGTRRPKAHVREMEAEQWAHAVMRAHSIPVPRAMTIRAKEYVARKIGQAERRGAKHIDPAARKFATRRKP